MSANLLDGITPRLFNGTTTTDDGYLTPERTSTTGHDDYIGFALSTERFTTNQTFHVGVSALCTQGFEMGCIIQYADSAGNLNWAHSRVSGTAGWSRLEYKLVVPSGMIVNQLAFSKFLMQPAVTVCNPSLSYATASKTNLIGSMTCDGESVAVGSGKTPAQPSNVHYSLYGQGSLTANRTMYVSALVRTEDGGAGAVRLGVEYKDSAGNLNSALCDFRVSGKYSQVGGKVVVPSGMTVVGAVAIAAGGSPVVLFTSMALYDGDRTPAARQAPTFDTSYWNRRIAFTRYRFAVVSRSSGMEIDPDVPVVHGGTITRNDDTRIKESAEVELLDPYDFGPNFLRVFLDAEWSDGVTVEVPLGTFIPVVPSRSVSNGRSRHSVKLYGRLQELLDDSFSSPVTIPSGTNAVEYAASVCRGVGLEVIADSSDYKTTNVRMYGVGADQNNSEVGTTKLDCVNDLLSLANFRAAMTDEMGRVLLKRYRDPADMPISWSFEEGPNAKFVGEFEEERDYTSAANHVIVRYGSLGDGTGKVVVGEAWDTDPDSDLSTVSRGRTITTAYTYQDLPEGSTDAEMSAYANARAATLLKTAQSIIRRETFTHTYVPVGINQAINIDFPTGGVSGRFQVRTQTLSLVGGCPIQCEARIFRRRVSNG